MLSAPLGWPKAKMRAWRHTTHKFPSNITTQPRPRKLSVLCVWCSPSLLHVRQSVRQREAACAAARRTAEWQQREARVAAVQQRRAAAEAEAIAEAASAEAARQLYKDQWAERAQAAVAREIHKEGASTRAAWRVTETKVISGRKLALGGLTSLTRKDEAEAKASMGK